MSAAEEIRDRLDRLAKVDQAEDRFFANAGVTFGFAGSALAHEVFGFNLWSLAVGSAAITTLRAVQWWRAEKAAR